MPDRYAVIVQEALWHGSPRRTGAPGANMAGDDGRPLWPQPATGMLGSDCIDAQRYSLGRLIYSVGGANLVIRTYQVQRSGDLIAKNLKRDIRKVVRPYLGQVLVCPFYDPNLARLQRGWPFDAEHAIRAYNEDRNWLIRMFALDKQAWKIDGRPAIIVWAGWTPGQHELCVQLLSEGWAVLLDYQGGRPDAQVPALADELRGSVDYVTGFTSNSPNETPEHGTRHDLTDVTVAHMRNMLAWQRAGIPAIPSLSPAYDDTPVMGDRALQVLYESRADLVACIKSAAEEAPDIGGYRTFGYHSGNCHREGTSIYDSMPPLGPVEYAADGLPTRLHPWGTMHLDALKEALT